MSHYASALVMQNGWCSDDSTNNTKYKNNIMRYVRYNYPSSRFSAATGHRRGLWGGLETEIDRLFNSALSGLEQTSKAGHMPVDLYQDEDNAYVRAELPGFPRDAIKVEVVDGYLTIEASRETKSDEGRENAKLNRSVALSDEVKADHVSAVYVDGVLTVTLPKKEEAKPRKISVAVK